MATRSRFNYKLALSVCARLGGNGIGKGDRVAARVWQIPEALGHQRIAKSHKDSERALSRPGQICGQGVRRLEPSAGNDDKLEIMEWVPEQFKATKAKPKKLSDFGAPSLLVDQTGGGGGSQEHQGLAYGWAWPIHHPSQRRVHIDQRACQRSPEQKRSDFFVRHPVIQSRANDE